MTKKRIIWIAAILVVVVVAIVAFTSGSNDNEAVKVQVANVERQHIVQTVSSTGVIQPETQVKISADVAAKITSLPVNEGDWVEKGQFLTQLDREKYLASVESAQANKRAAVADANLVKENMMQTEKEYIRIKGLFDSQLESQANMDLAHSKYMVEKARYQSSLEQVERADAALKQAKDDLSKTTIYAPMSGTISELNKELGEIALGSQFQEDVIMIVSDLTNMEALVDVDENDIVSVHLGDSAKIEVDAIPNYLFKGTVSEIASSAKVAAAGSADQKTEFEVKIRIIDPGKKLRPGMTASADIVTEIRDDALVVPIQSVSVRTPEQLGTSSEKDGQDSTGKMDYTPDKDGFVQVVFVVNNENKVKAIQVETGIQSDTHIEIKKGLAEKDEIVTGNYRAISQVLQNNTKVEADSNKQEALASSH